MFNQVDPFLLGVLCLLGVVSLGFGIIMLISAWTSWQDGMPTRFRIVDFAIIAAGEGTSFRPHYEVIDGPRKGDVVTSSGVESSVSTYTVMTTTLDTKHVRKARTKIGAECAGRVHPTRPVGMTKQDHFWDMFAAMACSIFGLFMAGVIGYLLFG